jgi:hypothetical protein
MTDETSSAPTDEQIAAARSSADSLVASSVADLVVLIEGVDLLTLRFALDAEWAKGEAARKGAIAALQSAIDGHPELSAQAAAAANADNAEPTEPGTVSLTLGAKVGEPPLSIQMTADGAPTGEPIMVPVPTDPQLDTTVTTIADEPLQDMPADPDAVSSPPPRPHQSLVDQLDMRWTEMKEFVRHLEGDVEHELGELLAFVRSKL